jgi:hypothetical protein
MANHSNARTIAAIEKMMNEMQYLVDHPRMQQRNWVAKGREWLPVLEHTKEDLQREVQQNDFVIDSHQALLGALAAIGLTVEKRDGTSWGYRWHKGTLEGAFPTQAAAVEAGLRERYE